jgi:hypothetical protein
MYVVILPRGMYLTNAALMVGLHTFRHEERVKYTREYRIQFTHILKAPGFGFNQP